MKSLSRAVIASFLICIAYTVTALIFTVKGYEISDTLTQYFFLTFGIEFAATASIKIAKTVIKSKETQERIDRLKENNLPVEKADLKDSDNDYDYDGGNTYYG